MKNQASEQSAFEQHMQFQYNLSLAIEFLTKLGGSDLHYNSYGATIIELRGIRTGLRLGENAFERIAIQNQKPEVGA